MARKARPVAGSLGARAGSWRVVLEACSDAIVATDSGQRIVLVNRAAERMFGYAAAELVGQYGSKLALVPGSADLWGSGRVSRSELDAMVGCIV